MSIDEIKGNIAKLQAALDRVNRDFDEALQEITVGGITANVQVCDSHGKRIEKPSIRHCCKVVGTAHKLRDQIGGQLGFFRGQLRLAEERAARARK